MLIRVGRSVYEKGVSTSCYEGSKLGDPLVFFFWLFSVSFLYYQFFVFRSLSSDIPVVERKRGRYTAKRIFGHYLRSPSESSSKEINGRSWSGSGSESCIYTFRPSLYIEERNTFRTIAVNRESNGPDPI